MDVVVEPAGASSGPREAKNCLRPRMLMDKVSRGTWRPFLKGQVLRFEALSYNVFLSRKRYAVPTQPPTIPPSGQYPPRPTQLPGPAESYVS